MIYHRKCVCALGQPFLRQLYYGQTADQSVVFETVPRKQSIQSIYKKEMNKNNSNVIA